MDKSQEPAHPQEEGQGFGRVPVVDDDQDPQGPARERVLPLRRGRHRLGGRRDEGRQPDNEGAALAWAIAGRLDLAVVPLHQASDPHQADAKSALAFPLGRLDLSEQLEQAGQVLARDADTRVGDHHQDSHPLLFRLNPDTRPGARSGRAPPAPWDRTSRGAAGSARRCGSGPADCAAPGPGSPGAHPCAGQPRAAPPPLAGAR